MLSARVERLLAMGDLDSANRLLDQLPPAVDDPALARLGAEAALLTGDGCAGLPARGRARADRRAPRSGARSRSIAAWPRATATARGSGSSCCARPGRARMRPSSSSPAASPTAPRAARRRPCRRRTPIHLALLRLAGQPFPAAALADAPPALLTAIARDPVLAGERQLEIAERAFAAGGLAARSSPRSTPRGRRHGDALEQRAQRLGAGGAGARGAGRGRPAEPAGARRAARRDLAGGDRRRALPGRRWRSRRSSPSCRPSGPCCRSRRAPRARCSRPSGRCRRRAGSRC